MNKHLHLKALVLTAAAPVLWSAGGIGVRLLDLDSWSILFWRSFFMVLTVLFWGLVKHRGEFFRSFKSNLFPVLATGGLLAAAFVLYIFSITLSTVAASLLIQGTAPVFIVALGCIFLHERFRRITGIALALVVAGILIIMLPTLRDGRLPGNLYGLGKALAFAAATIIVRSRKSLGMLPAMVVAGVISMIFALPWMPGLSLDPYSLAILFLLGVFQLGLSFLFFMTWSGKLPSAQTGLLVILEAVLGPLWTWIFLGERPEVWTFVGGGLILLSLVLHALILNRPVGSKPITPGVE